MPVTRTYCRKEPSVLPPTPPSLSHTAPLAQVRDPAKGTVYIVAEARLASLPGAVPKPKKGAAKKGDGKDAVVEMEGGFEVRWHGGLYRESGVLLHCCPTFMLPSPPPTPPACCTAALYSYSMSMLCPLPSTLLVPRPHAAPSPLHTCSFCPR